MSALTPAGYAAGDVERWAEEPDTRSGRSPFARDRARVLHSAGLRRLADKTQVVRPGSDHFHRTRLTHTLEVAQVGRELGAALGCDPDLVDTACLAHDLGHPPFGHSGEAALGALAEKIGGFEGNAQTLRLLTRLEAKTPAAGLNLTRAALDAATKYPWTRGHGPDTGETAGGEAAGCDADGRSGDGKFGVYAADLEVFGWFRDGDSSHRRCLEAQVMDFADDVAYSVHDVEDGIVAGAIDPSRLRSPVEWSAIVEAVRDWYAPAATVDELEAAYGRVTGLDCWPTGPHDGTRTGLAGLKALTSRLIGRFCTAAERATRAGYPGPLTRYRADLQVPPAVRFEIVVLKGIAARFMMRTEAAARLRVGQAELLGELVVALADRAPNGLDRMFADDYREAADDDARLRVVIDQVSSMTDASATDAWRRLCRSSGTEPMVRPRS